MSHPVPWYKDPTSSHHFSLAKKFNSNAQNSTPFKSLAFFPWIHSSCQTLWNGHYNISQEDWSEMIHEFSDAVAVGSDRKIYVFFASQSRNPISFNIPISERDLKASPTDCVRVAWALYPHAPLAPLLLFSYLNVIYIFNVKRQVVWGYLRGHGGAITSIAVHPIHSNLFCTTSKDYTTRIYDLSLEPNIPSPENVPNNPHWPPGMEKSFAGAAHGLHMMEPEGGSNGIGRCIIVLMGGRSGGHQAAVLGAAFNEHFPVVATCGLDRVVKIWHVPRASAQGAIVREDKPLFSSSRIHKARVLSVTWLQPDLLLSHSAPAVMKQTSPFPTTADSKATWIEAGQLVVWRWLALDRFFPPAHQDVRQDALRGCASDYQESSSFKIISALSFPPVSSQFEAHNLHVYQSPTHDPIVSFTIPKSNLITMFNVIHLQPRKPPPFPFDIVDVANGDHLDEEGEKLPISQSAIPPQVSGWELSTVVCGVEDGLIACAMGMDGKTVIGVGSQGGRGAMWIWRLSS